MAKPLPKIDLTDEERNALIRIIKKPTSPQGIAQRAQIVLLADRMKSTSEIMQTLSVSKSTVVKWRQNFAEKRIDGLKDAPRSGRKPLYDQQAVTQLISKTLEPPEHITHWSTREMAKEFSMAHMTVHRIWKKNNLKPHLVKTFKYSNDKNLEEKIIDIVGLYLDPPENAIVLSVDEKSQIQALERTQPLLPLKFGQAERQTHDYKRHGTTTLFAALDTADGSVIGKCYNRHRHQEFLKFLNLINRNVHKDKDVHIITDNYSTHKHAKVKSWIKWRNQRYAKKHGVDRIVQHFTPTSSSWMNLVERFFRDVTEDVIREGSFGHVQELIDDIELYLEQRDENPTIYKWKAEGEKILAKIQKARQKLQTL